MTPEAAPVSLSPSSCASSTGLVCTMMLRWSSSTPSALTAAMASAASAAEGKSAQEKGDQRP